MSNNTLMLVAELAIMFSVVQLVVILGLLRKVKELKASSKTGARLAMALIRNKKRNRTTC